MREKIRSTIIEMIIYHKDLQHLPKCNYLLPYFQGYFQVPESGLLSCYGTYEISTWGIKVELWSNKRYRFRWSSIMPYIQAYRSKKEILLFDY